jgi:hypothetical protein
VGVGVVVVAGACVGVCECELLVDANVRTKHHAVGAVSLCEKKIDVRR